MNHRIRGFTLIELMVAIAIIAIIAMMAISVGKGVIKNNSQSYLEIPTASQRSMSVTISPEEQGIAYSASYYILRDKKSNARILCYRNSMVILPPEEK